MKNPSYMSVRDVFDYFGKCPRCGYPADASETVRRFPDGEIEREVTASCGLPCGWRGPAELRASPLDDVA
ncbi:hypothetical protein ACIO14_25310 [Nocardia fluminea]|uniref:hypothetical protein n=1 Tax=Nocardia fluminea TaxID=134984 RepID=UPI0038269918